MPPLQQPPTLLSHMWRICAVMVQLRRGHDGLPPPLLPPGMNTPVCASSCPVESCVGVMGGLQLAERPQQPTGIDAFNPNRVLR